MAEEKPVVAEEVELFEPSVVLQNKRKRKRAEDLEENKENHRPRAPLGAFSFYDEPIRVQTRFCPSTNPEVQPFESDMHFGLTPPEQALFEPTVLQN